MSDEMQQRHAAKIRTERALIDITGWSRSQARTNLANFTRQVATIQSTPKVEVPLKPLAEVKSETQKFELKPITSSQGTRADRQANPPVTNELPNGELGDILYSDGSDWVVLNAPESDGLFVLSVTVSSGVPTIAWLGTTACP